MKSERESSIFEFTNSFTPKNGEYTVLVLLQDVDLARTLLPAAIRAANRHDGKIILLNIIDIPYQLPPSDAKRFKLEREFKLEYARYIVETAGCDVDVKVRIAHRIPYALHQISLSLEIDLIVMWGKKKGLLWDKNMYQKLYDVDCNLLIAKEQVKNSFEEVIIQVDDPQIASAMLEQATYLLGSNEGNIHVIPDFRGLDESLTLKKIRAIVNEFNRQHSWFKGKTIINQLQPKSATKEYLNKMYHEGTGSTGILVPYPSGKKSGAGPWLSEEAEKLNLPVFLSKVGRVEPSGVYRFTNKIKKWMGMSS